jgi:hypothetical protein
MPIISKSEFALRHGVGKAAVSNWIARGKLHGPALAGGRIDTDHGDAQLGRTVHPVMAASARALGAAAAPAPPAPPPPTATPSSAAVEDIAAHRQLLRARAVSAAVDAERKRREFERERGRYMRTAEAEAEFTRVLGDFLTATEGGLGNLALALGLDRAQTVELRRWWRERRAKAAETNRVAAAAEPAFVPDTTAG